MDLDAGKADRQLTLLDLDEPLDDAGRGPSGLLCPAPYRLHPPMGLPEDPVGRGIASVQGPLDRRLLAIPRRPDQSLGAAARSRLDRSRSPAAATGPGPPLLGPRPPPAGPTHPIPVDGRLFIGTHLAGVGGPRPSVRRVPLLAA